MNTLTPNRIIEKGDEYFQSGEWHPVPPNDIGLQIQFTKYKEVRRPSEKATPISPKPPQAAKAEAKQVPASGVSPAGGESPNITLTPVKPRPLSETFGKKPKAAKAKELPTVISQVAHGKERFRVGLTPRSKAALKAIVADAEARVIHGISTKEAIKLSKPTSKGVYADILIPYTDLSALPNWIGRNGRFKAIGIKLTATPAGLIQVVPVGARGVAKNALIEFPATEISKVVDFLLRHQPAPK